ncbi:MAG: peptide chain release factor N(5)-glutamine methyltransferase [Chitinophagaceae bacterium]
MKYSEIYRGFILQLRNIYSSNESMIIADWVFEKIAGLKRADIIKHPDQEPDAVVTGQLDDCLSSLLVHKPVQYVLGEAWFFKMKFRVNEQVLIPRPETEELLDWIIDEVRPRQAGLQGLAPDERNGKIKGGGICILDIGTGSGCIALGLKNKLPLAEIYACDVSEDALAVARKNALAQEVTVHFIHCDFLNKEAIHDLPQFTIIVSNPPYIPLQDKTTMHPNVLLYEPHLALFVEDEDLLVFYQSIADFAKTHLIGMGDIFVEIHEQMGDGVKKIFIQRGFENVELRKDLQGRERMIRVKV